jgi:hypothetical protein
MASQFPFEIDVDAPLEVYGDEIRVPEAILRYVPSDSTTVSALLERSLPTILDGSVVDLEAESFVTDHAPRWTIGELIETPIPPITWIFRAEQAIRKAEIGSVSSVRHPTLPDLYLPLWAIMVWYSLNQAAEHKDKWRNAKGWALKQAMRDPKASEVTELMERTPWGMELWILKYAPSTRVGIIAELLSADFIRERQLDVIASYLNSRASKDNGSARKCWAGDVYVLTQVKDVYNKNEAAGTSSKATTSTGSKGIQGTYSSLTSYQDMIIAKGYSRLLLPANLLNFHWIVFSVDLVKKQFSFGTPSFSSPPMWQYTGLTIIFCDPGNSLGQGFSGSIDNTCLALKDWLDSAFGPSFKNQGNILPIMSQHDGCSCGVYVADAMERAMFGGPPLGYEGGHSLRIRYFIETVKYLLEIVRLEHSTEGCNAYIVPLVLRTCR